MFTAFYVTEFVSYLNWLFMSLSLLPEVHTDLGHCVILEVSFDHNPNLEQNDNIEEYHYLS